MTLKELRNAIIYLYAESENLENDQNVFIEFYDMENHKLVLYSIDDLIRIKQSDGGEYYTFRLKL